MKIKDIAYNDAAINDFETFCEANEVKPTNMKADYYLAGYHKGEARQRDKAKEAFCKSHGCEIPSSTCHSLGTCMAYDAFARALCEQMEGGEE